MRIISVINQKGGCGKTTTTINLGACLAAAQRRVLLIDLDPQGHTSLGLNIRPEEVTKGMTEVLTQGAELSDVVLESISPNLDLAPANLTLSAVEQLLAEAPHKEQKLLRALQTLRKSYQYVIIDSPPSLGLLTFNALRASHEAIVPVEMGFFSLHGLAKLMEIIDVLARHTGHEVKVRALATMVNTRTKFTQEMIDEIRRHFQGQVFATLIRNNVRLREAASHGLPIMEYDAESIGARDYQALAREVVMNEIATERVVPAVAASVAGGGAYEPEQFFGPITVEELFSERPE
jgi:chromosome partitioning protein